MSVAPGVGFAYPDFIKNAQRVVTQTSLPSNPSRWSS